jgi:hypothetical protein
MSHGNQEYAHILIRGCSVDWHKGFGFKPMANRSNMVATTTQKTKGMAGFLFNHAPE